jgi:hypothetical protein
MAGGAGAGVFYPVPAIHPWRRGGPRVFVSALIPSVLAPAQSRPFFLGYQKRERRPREAWPKRWPARLRHERGPQPAARRPARGPRAAGVGTETAARSAPRTPLHRRLILTY